jgi:hypothetical protein
MSYVKVALPAAVLLGGFLFCTTVIRGTPAYARQEKKACNFCHTVAAPKDAETAKDLTDAGKYFKEHKSLEGFKK